MKINLEEGKVKCYERKNIGTLGRVGHKLSDNTKMPWPLRRFGHPESDRTSAVCQRNIWVVTDWQFGYLALLILRIFYRTCCWQCCFWWPRRLLPVLGPLWYIFWWCYSAYSHLNPKLLDLKNSRNQQSQITKLPGLLRNWRVAELLYWFICILNFYLFR